MDRKTTLAGVVCLLFAATLFAQDARDGSLVVIEEVHEHYATLDLDGVVMSDGSIRVTIAELDGSSVYVSRFPVVKADGKYLEWEYRGETPYSMSRRVDEIAVRTLQDMTRAAKDVVRLIKTNRVPGMDRPGQLAVKVDDNHGCDWPFEALSETSAGNCCDSHDICYAAFRCDGLSWLGLNSYMCGACNLQLVACIGDADGSYGSTFQPSECVSQGNCGQPRSANVWGNFSDVDLGGALNLELLPHDGSGGGGGVGSIHTTPWGQIHQGAYGPGTCRFPDGQVIPCG